jgi:hypothetical protein
MVVLSRERYGIVGVGKLVGAGGMDGRRVIKCAGGSQRSRRFQGRAVCFDGPAQPNFGRLAVE